MTYVIDLSVPGCVRQPNEEDIRWSVETYPTKAKAKAQAKADILGSINSSMSTIQAYHNKLKELG